MEVSNNIHVPNRGRIPEYFIGNEVYEIDCGQSIFFSDSRGLNKARILSRLQFINYNNKDIKKEEYRSFVSKMVEENNEKGFRIWRIK